ncbi:MAG: TRAP transporter substrate-binding protein [Sedimentibacter sp.]
MSLKNGFYKGSISVILVLGMLMMPLSGCSEKAVDSSNGSTEESTETIKLSFATYDPAQSGNTIYQQEWADKIKEATNGKVEITIYPGGTLAAATDILDAVKTGACDMGWVFTSFYPGQFPLTDIATLPMLGINSATQGTNMLWDLYENTDELKKEYDDFQMLMLYTNNPNIISTSDKPVQSMSDLKGMKLRCPAGAATDMVTAWGGTPILMGPGDMYQSIEKGVIEGCVFEYLGIGSYKLTEVLNNFTEMPINVGPFLVLMNKAKWDSLPEDVKTAISSVSNKETSLGAAKVFEDVAADVRKEIASNGGNLITVTEEAYNEFKKATVEYNSAWYGEHKTSEFDAEKYYEKALEAIEKNK